MLRYRSDTKLGQLVYYKISRTTKRVHHVRDPRHLPASRYKFYSTFPKAFPSTVWASLPPKTSTLNATTTTTTATKFVIRQFIRVFPPYKPDSDRRFFITLYFSLSHGCRCCCHFLLYEVIVLALICYFRTSWKTMTSSWTPCLLPRSSWTWSR